MTSKKTILITGSTDGIGYEAAKTLIEQGHRVLLHGRNPEKLAAKIEALQPLSPEGKLRGYICDLSSMAEVEALAKSVAADHKSLDVLLNNAGILKTSKPVTAQGHDVRFLVNTFAPYLLAKRLLPIIPKSGRIINLSSAAQNPIDFDALAGREQLSEMDAYAQSKLGITIWSRALADKIGNDGPLVVSVNPASLIGTKMVKEGFGMEGKDIRIGADILVESAIGESFEGHTGKYFDNDAGAFGRPHPDAEDPVMIEKVMAAIEEILPEVA